MDTKNDKIVLYSLPTCGMCMMLKKLLKEKNISYESVMDMNTLTEKGITHVPVLEVNGKRYEFKDALNLVKEM